MTSEGRNDSTWFTTLTRRVSEEIHTGWLTPTSIRKEHVRSSAETRILRSIQYDPPEAVSLSVCSDSNMETDSSVLASVKQYAKLGLSVNSLSYSDKPPIVKWERYQQRWATEAELKRCEAEGRIKELTDAIAWTLKHLHRKQPQTSPIRAQGGI